MDFGIFYEIQANSPLKHREREYDAFHQVLQLVDREASPISGQSSIISSPALPIRRRRKCSMAQSRIAPA